MKLLLDSHIYLWVADDRFTDRLSERLKQLIASSESAVFISIVSIWELTIKLEKHRQTFDFDERLLEVDAHFPFEILELKPEHVVALKNLDGDRENPIHRDPFDCIMLAQAMREGLTFVTHDRHCLQYAHPEMKVLDASKV